MIKPPRLLMYEQSNEFFSGTHLKPPMKGKHNSCLSSSRQKGLYPCKYVGEEILNVCNCCTHRIQCATANTRKGTSVQYQYCLNNTQDYTLQHNYYYTHTFSVHAGIQVLKHARTPCHKHTSLTLSQASTHSHRSSPLTVSEGSI